MYYSQKISSFFVDFWGRVKTSATTWRFYDDEVNKEIKGRTLEWGIDNKLVRLEEGTDGNKILHTLLLKHYNDSGKIFSGKLA